MDYKSYEMNSFDLGSAFSMSTGLQGRSYQKHWHFQGQIILAGAGDDNVYMVNQTVYHLAEGDFILAWPMETHEIIDADRKDALIIQYGNSFMNSHYDLQMIMYYFRNLHAIKRENHPELMERLGVIVSKMKEIYLSNVVDREIRCCMLLMDFMLALDEHRDEFTSELKRERRNHYNENTLRHVLKVTDYVKSHLTEEDLSQAAMAEMAGISKDYFSRIFKNVTGENYGKWLNHVRLEQAKECLIQKDKSITEAAMLSGFKSVASFNRVFQEETGMSPSEYRSLQCN